MNNAPTTQYLTAFSKAFACAVSGWKDPSGNPVPVIYNTAQTYAFMCPDGLVFYYTVAGGLFASTNQANANAQALAYAELLAGEHAICLSSPNPTANVSVPYLSFIQATGEALAKSPATDSWVIVSGMVPPGLTLNHGGFINGQAQITGGMCPITGTPTLAGSYSFMLRVTDPDGDSMQKLFTITVGS